LSLSSTSTRFFFIFGDKGTFYFNRMCSAYRLINAPVSLPFSLVIYLYAGVSSSEGRPVIPCLPDYTPQQSIEISLLSVFISLFSGPTVIFSKVKTALSSGAPFFFFGKISHWLFFLRSSFLSRTPFYFLTLTFYIFLSPLLLLIVR